MGDQTKIALGSFATIAAIILFMVASDVGIARAKAAQACFEAAKVNENIKCE